MPEQKFVVPESADGVRIDRFLAEHFGSRSQAQKLIAAGEVKVDGAKAAKSLQLLMGQTVEVPIADKPVRVESVVASEPVDPGSAESQEIDVLFEDENLLVINKPAGLLVHPGAGSDEVTLVDLIRDRLALSEFELAERAGIVHRLDRDTSGLLIVAKNLESLREMQKLISDRDVVREYLALVDGRPRSLTGTIEAPIGRDRMQRTKHSLDTDTPRHAITHFRIEERFHRTTLLRVTLQTGRTHQIRVHLQAIKLPVCGDSEYGRSERLGLTRQFLHAQKLSFVHPFTGEQVTIESNLPGDLVEALERAKAGELNPLLAAKIAGFL